MLLMLLMSVFAILAFRARRAPRWALPALVLWCTVLLVPLAYAATPSAPVAAPAIVDLSAIVNMVLEAFAMVLIALAGWALLWVKNHYKLQVDEQTRQYLSNAIYAAISYGKVKAEGLIDPRAKITVSNPVVAVAADYLVAHVPDAIAHFGLTPDALERLIVSRLPNTEMISVTPAQGVTSATAGTT